MKRAVHPIPSLAVGTGRCGTKTWARQINTIEGVWGFHEGACPTRNNWRWCSPHLVQGSELAREWNETAIKARMLRIRALHRENAGTYAEAAHYFAQNLDLLEQLSPSTKIIHLLRDPAEMICSFISFSPGQIYYAAKGQHEPPRERWVKWSDSFPLYPRAESIEEQLASHWEACNRAISSTRLPRLLVRTEELGSAETWKKMLGWLGIEGEIDDPGKVHNKSREKYGVSDRAEAAVEKFCSWEP